MQIWWLVKRRIFVIFTRRTANKALVNDGIKQEGMQVFFRFLVGVVFISSTMSVHAQFEGLTSFFNDTVLTAKVKASKVHSAQEFILQNGAPILLKKYYFNNNGKVCDMFTLGGNL